MVTDAPGAAASVSVFGDHRRATKTAPAATAAKRQDQLPNITVTRCGTDTPVSQAIRRRLSGRLTRQVPTREPIGTPTGPNHVASPRQAPAVTRPSARFVSEILRWWPKQNTQ